eukprot:1935144-Prymnesium_polylepis.1
MSPARVSSRHSTRVADTLQVTENAFYPPNSPRRAQNTDVGCIGLRRVSGGCDGRIGCGGYGGCAGCGGCV